MKSFSEKQSTSVAGINSSKCKVLKGKSPLKNFKFYLDISNSQVSKKIERQVKELGGSLEFFLTDEVTHFITDNLPQNSPNNSASNFSPISLASNKSDSVGSPRVSNEFKANAKTQSRANAMLHRALQGTYQSPQTNAKRNVKELERTCVWHTTFALKFFNKIINKKFDHNCNQSKVIDKHNSVELKGNFIKIESVQKCYRPYYKILKDGWPLFSLRKKHQETNVNENDKKSSVKISKPINAAADMTRKSRSSKHLSVKRKRNSSEKGCGFCEICKVEYDALSVHLKSKEHNCFAKNDSNFHVLDSLIKASANVDSFLHENSTKLIDSELSLLKSPRSANELLDLNMGARQTRQKTTRQIVNNYSPPIETTEKKSPAKVNRELNQLTKSLRLENEKSAENCSKDVAIENEGSHRKRGSSDRPVMPRNMQNSLLYKVIQSNETSNSAPNSMNSGEPNTPLIVKLKKVRQTELSILNGEAENFMFPKKSATSCYSDRQTSTSEHARESSSSLISSEESPSKVKRLEYDYSRHNSMRRRNQSKRKSEEMTETCDEQTEQTTVKEEPSTEDDGEPSKQMKSMSDALADEKLLASKFAFERVPFHESWYSVFDRQDQTREKMFEYYGSTAYRRLPYEMGPLSTKQLNHCHLCPKNPEPEKIKNSTESKVQITNTITKAESKSLSITKSECGKESKVGESKTTDYLKQRFLNLDIPRKSPREHASTLAILSCIIQQAKNDKTKSTSRKSSTNRSEKPAIANTNSPTKSTCTDTAKDRSNPIRSPDIIDTVKSSRRSATITSALARVETEIKSPKKSVKVANKKIPKKYSNTHKDSRLRREDENYVNVLSLEKDIDSFLLSSVDGDFIDDDIDSAIGSSSCKRSTTFFSDCDLIDVVQEEQVTFGHLHKYRMFTASKKRKNNRTGWPSKKRISSTLRRCNERQSTNNAFTWEQSIEKDNISSVSCSSSPVQTFCDNSNTFEHYTDSSSVPDNLMLNATSQEDEIGSKFVVELQDVYHEDIITSSRPSSPDCSENEFKSEPNDRRKEEAASPKIVQNKAALNKSNTNCRSHKTEKAISLRKSLRNGLIQER